MPAYTSSGGTRELAPLRPVVCARAAVRRPVNRRSARWRQVAWQRPPFQRKPVVRWVGGQRAEGKRLGPRSTPTWWALSFEDHPDACHCARGRRYSFRDCRWRTEVRSCRDLRPCDRDRCLLMLDLVLDNGSATCRRPAHEHERFAVHVGSAPAS